ncbi:glycosyltransferase [Ignavibacteria bacterium]|nr:glycosyltransferase family 4 protein [Bacteroidota bacterium]MCZ2132694.1 glycosyltransferase family 4 protein [Bacteroidota bacterium]
MKTVLVIAYYFPPSGGPGVQRVLKHTQYLSEFGWRPVVLTVENGEFPARDESLLAKIPADVPVYRSHIYEPYDIYRAITGKSKGTPIDVNNLKKDNQRRTFKESLAEFIRATIFIPDARIGWLPAAVKAGKELIRKYNVSVIYSSSPPYTCSLIGRALQCRSGLPWVAGFRDPWTGFLTTPKRWFLPSAIDRRLERSVFRRADAIECAWQGIAADALRKYPDLPPEKFHYVPNGFDSNDFPAIRTERNDVFTLTYAGSMYGRRNPSLLFEAIEKLLAAGKITVADFRLRFVGRFGDEVKEMFEKASFRRSIEIIPYLPHEESVKALMSSDALLLIVDEAKESAEIVPGKVFEYIGVKKPVLAVAPIDGAVAGILRETKCGIAVEQGDAEGCARAFLGFLHGSSDFAPNVEAVKHYERREAAKKLADILNAIVAAK